MRGRGPSFQRLVREALPGVDWALVLRGLLALGLVEKRPGAKLKAKARSLILKQRTQTTLGRAIQVIDALTATIHSNLIRSRARRGGHGLFERTTHSEMFDSRQVRALDKLVRLHGQALLEFLDSWMSKHEARPSHPRTRRAHVGVGIYLFSKARP